MVRAVLDGQQIAITGTMASMSRDEAADLIRRCGGEPAGTPTQKTAYVVVGQEGLPVGADGQLSDALEKAQSLQDQGHDLRVISEQEFLEMLRLAGDNAAERVRRLYTVTQLSRILKIPGRVIRSWVRRDLIRPVRTELRLDYFDFRQMTELRTLRELTEQGVATEEIRNSLAKLRNWFPGADRSLGRLDEMEDQLLTRADDGVVSEPSGQLRLGFEFPAPAGEDRRAADDAGTRESGGKPAAGVPSALPSDPARPGESAPSPATRGKVTPLRPVREKVDAPRPEPVVPILRVVADTPAEDVRATGSAEDWTERALDLEEDGDLAAAATAYEQALLGAGPDPELAFNLGNVLYALGRLDEAAVRFRQAVQLDDEYVEAWNNLGGVAADLGQWEESILASQRALELAPDYADPHYNLAEAYAASSRYGDARLHANRYLQHDPDSLWAVRLRADLGIRK